MILCSGEAGRARWGQGEDVLLGVGIGTLYNLSVGSCLPEEFLGLKGYEVHRERLTRLRSQEFC